MTETVDFRLEQSLPELQDLLQKELFTPPEIKQIIKKRTEHEHILLRRSAKKSDYLRYVAYELNLESLRQKRCRRNKQSMIFERERKKD
jgi:U3 small nucleolar RNA-associated protein 6